MRSIHPFDDYRLALVAGADGALVAPSTVTSDGTIETDLFAGIRGTP